eukprot:m.149598 g.149598  ORF g.149598 m.149598 type:complete len:182 (+) comp16298_c0_seq1:120-665(+)
MAESEELQQLQTEHDLTEKQIAAFRTVFGFLDLDKSGVVTAEELHHRLLELDIDVSMDEVLSAMTLVPSSNAEHSINFQGFLEYMTCNHRYARTLTTEESARQEAILFLAVTKYIESKKNTSEKSGGTAQLVAELESYYVAKAQTYHPHVISTVCFDWVERLHLKACCRRLCGRMAIVGID